MQPSGRPTGQPTLSPTGALTTQVTFKLSMVVSNYTSSPRILTSTSRTTRRIVQSMFASAINAALGGDINSAYVASSSGNQDCVSALDCVTFIDTVPTGQPTRQPSRQPTRQPTGQPSRQPTRQPTGQPTGQPTKSGQPHSRRRLLAVQAHDLAFSFSVKVMAERYCSKISCGSGDVSTAAYSKAVDMMATSASSSSFGTYLYSFAKASTNDTNFLRPLSTLTPPANPACNFGVCLVQSSVSISILHSAKPTGTPTSRPSVIFCAAGFYHDLHLPQCHTCLAGKYSTYDAYNCTSCPAGTSSPDAGSHCSDCEIGYISTHVAAPSCQKCTWPYTTLTKKSLACNYSCYCLNTANLTASTVGMLLLYIALMLYSGFSRKDRETAEEKMAYSFRMFAFTALPLLDFVTDFVYILSSDYAHVSFLAVSIICTLLPTVFFLRKLYLMGALMPRLFVPLPYFAANMRYMWWLRFEKGFPRYVNAWDPPKEVLEEKLRLARVRLERSNNYVTTRDVERLENQLVGYGPNGELPWHKFDASFDKHDSLPKLMMFWILWGMILSVQAFYIMAWFFIVLPIFFINSPVIFSWAVIGAYLYQSKCLAIASTWNIWIRVWHGHSKKRPCPFFTKEGKAPHYDPAIDTVLMNESLYACFLCEAIPQLIVQTLNNMATGKWTSLAILSIATSSYMVCMGAYRYLTYTRSTINVNGTRITTLVHTDIRKVPMSYWVPGFQVRPGSSLPELFWVKYDIDHGTFSERFMKEFAAKKPWIEVLKDKFEEAKRRMLPEHVEDPGARVKLVRKKDGKNIIFELMDFDRRKLGLPTKTKKDEVNITIDDLVPYVDEQKLGEALWKKKKGRNEGPASDLFDPEQNETKAGDSDKEEGDDDDDDDDDDEEEKEEALSKIDPSKILRTVLDAEFEFHHSDEDSYDDYSDIDPVGRDVYLMNSDDDMDGAGKKPVTSSSRDDWLGGFGSFFYGTRSENSVRERADSRASQGSEGDDEIGAASSFSRGRNFHRSFNNSQAFRASQRTLGEDQVEAASAAAAAAPPQPPPPLKAPVGGDEQMEDLYEGVNLAEEIAAMEAELIALQRDMTQQKQDIRTDAPHLYPKSKGTVDPDALKAVRRIQDTVEQRREMQRVVKQRMFEKKFNTLEIAQRQPFAVRVPDILKKETRTMLSGVTTAGSETVQLFKESARSKKFEEYVERLKHVEIGSSVSGTGIPPGATIVDKDATSLTLSDAPTESVSQVRLLITHLQNFDALSPKKKDAKKVRNGYKLWWHAAKDGGRRALASARSAAAFLSARNVNEEDADDEGDGKPRPKNLGSAFEGAAAREGKSRSTRPVVTVVTDEHGVEHEEGSFFRDHDPDL